MKTLLNIFFPKKCFGCHQEGTICCTACENSIQSTKPSKRPFLPQSIEKIIVASCYSKNPILKKLIQHLKYKGEKHETPEILTNLLQKAISEETLPENTILIPVPLHPKRRKYRGFNQSEILTKLLATKTKLQENNHILKRIKHTKPQVEVSSKKARQQNLSNCFQAQNAPPHCLLIDDVCTTSTTLDECAKALKKAGAKKVYALVLAHNS